MAFDVIADAQAASTLCELEKTAGGALRSYGFDVVTAVEISRRGNERIVEPLFGDIAAAPMLHYTERGHGAYLRRYAEERSEDDDGILADAAEEIILDHRPADRHEAVVIIGTLIANLSAGARCDRRDVGALHALQAWLSQDLSAAA